jgi:hypothetical protein
MSILDAVRECSPYYPLVGQSYVYNMCIVEVTPLFVPLIDVHTLDVKV